MEEGEASGQSSADNPSETHSAYLQQLLVENVCKAALMEIIAKAAESGFWNFSRPAFGFLDEFLPMFRDPPLAGRRVEYSIGTGIIPIEPENLASVMTNMDHWSSYFPYIVYSKSSKPQKACDSSLKDLQLVDAEFHLPTPFLRIRKFRFLRFRKEIVPHIWAIVDVGEDYLHLTPQDTISESMCRRRPSGVIIRDHDKMAEVIWIENVEVSEYEPQPEHITYSEAIRSNKALGASRWIDEYCWTLERCTPAFRIDKIQLKDEKGKDAEVRLLCFASVIRRFFLDCVSESPDKIFWKTIQATDTRVLRNISMEHFQRPHLANTYTAVTSIQVHKKPLQLFKYLLQKNLKLQLPVFEGSEEVVRVVNGKGNFCLSVHKRAVAQDGFEQHFEYLLQEESNDGYCLFVISATMTGAEFLDAVLEYPQFSFYPPSGFAIIPDGPAGLHSDSSLLSIVIQQELESNAVSKISELIWDIIAEIYQEVSTWSEE